jgi:hypothetical protein
MNNRIRLIDASASKSKHIMSYRRALSPDLPTVGLTAQQSSDINLGRALRSHHKWPGLIFLDAISGHFTTDIGSHMTFLSNQITDIDITTCLAGKPEAGGLGRILLLEHVL